MSQRALRFILMVTAVLLASGEPTLRAQHDPVPTIVVPRDVRTIQEAVDAIPDGGRIVVQPGRYEETVFIRNKTVHLVGRDRPQWVGRTPERVVDAEDVVALVNYSAGGGGSLRGFSFIGGDTAIAGYDERLPPGRLEVEEVSIQGSGRGILWAYSQLVAKTVVVSKSLGHALALKQTPQFVLDDLDLLDNLGVGIYVLDSGCTCDDQVCIIKHTFANGNLNGGILAVRSGLCISETSMMDNWIFGLRAVGSAIRLKGFGVAGTRARFDGAWGNGIDAMPDALPSTISVSTGWVVSSERAGIAAIGSLIKLKNTLVQCSAFDLENETVQANDYGPGRPLTIQFGTYDNLGGDFCGCPIAVGTCVSQSAGGPSPPPAIPAQ